ncbi:FGGY-family carbohydrate kinase [Sinorhizobium sp. BG8]|uniref:FGGY-family carbohydrate kinase n=1 Tax=Sinorhizobium sp. BG8 TaxID=2613773 RepID=UPI00193DC780|nr:FGGY-family carbohydrate kinase [Sinorhizobium sp. BG8]QRM57374.1 FGGY-family carbohydrate kinase [Sinorhizobium sp. BG8]
MTADIRAIAIGIDVGTTGVRAAALTKESVVVALAAVPFRSPSESREPRSWWAGVCDCIAQIAGQISLTTIEGLAVDGTSGTVLAIDADGHPVGDVLMYNDPCPDSHIVDRIAAVAPAASPARGANSGLARAIHLARRPGVVRLVHQVDWILLQLGLETPLSDENNALKSGYDLRCEDWPDWIEAAGLERHYLPTVKRAGTPLAPVGAAGRRLGLPEGCVLHAGTTDGCASFLATGASAVGDAVTALGSTMVLKLASDHPVDAPEYGIYAHRVLDFWLVGGASNSGGAVIRALVGDDRLEALSDRLDIDRPTGLDYYPLLKPGERFPINDPTYAPRLEPRPQDDAVFFQAILEGITAIERLGYTRLEGLGAPRLRSVRTVGGGARNPVWREMRQRALGVEFLEPHSLEAAVGTAKLVLAGRQSI